MDEATQQKLKEHADKWIKIALRTDPIEPKEITPIIKGLYKAAGLKEPRVVIVSSPFAMAVAGGIASAYLELKERPSIAGYVPPEIASAVRLAFQGEGVADKGDKPIDMMGRDIVKGYAGDEKRHEKLLESVRDWSNHYQGGNLWSGYDSYLTAFRDVLGLELECFEKYKWWEMAAIHGSFRYLHEEFCIVADFPDRICLNEDNVPHSEDGPSHRWRDGWSLWHVGGVRVDEQIVMQPETQTLQQIEGENNQEVKRIRIERYGWTRYLDESGAEIVHQERNDRDAQFEKLYRLADGQQRFVCIDPSTARKYALGVPREVQTCEQARLWMSNGLDKFAVHRS